MTTVNLPILIGARGEAVISECGRYRYRLTRRWAEGVRRVLWIMLNPSTADHDRDDLTIKKCIGFSKLWQASALTVINLFAYRATSPRTLLKADDPTGTANVSIVREAGLDCDKVIVAWGNLPNELWVRSQLLRQIVSVEYGTPEQSKLQCLGRTKDGQPRHPSRLAYATALEDWR